MVPNFVCLPEWRGAMLEEQGADSMMAGCSTSKVWWMQRFSLFMTGSLVIAGWIAFAQGKPVLPEAKTVQALAPAAEFEVASVKENKTADQHAHSHIYSSPNNGEFTAIN